uniref:Uncharacterized protein n=1 Tax=Cacopsylla melanoneura TaxID=428564 RepID=A0A8D8QGT2_9HEMI
MYCIVLIIVLDGSDGTPGKCEHSWGSPYRGVIIINCILYSIQVHCTCTGWFVTVFRYRVVRYSIQVQGGSLPNSKVANYATRARCSKNIARKTRAQKLKEFKEEKLKKKLEEQKKKLPPFRAGVVRHAMNSPYKFDHKDEAPPTNKKFNFEGIKPKIKPCLKITIPQSPKFSSLARHRHCVDSAQAVQMPPPGR